MGFQAVEVMAVERDGEMAALMADLMVSLLAALKVVSVAV